MHYQSYKNAPHALNTHSNRCDFDLNRISCIKAQFTIEPISLLLKQMGNTIFDKMKKSFSTFHGNLAVLSLYIVHATVALTIIKGEGGKLKKRKLKVGE